MPTVPAKLELLVYQTWQNRFPSNTPGLTTDYEDLFGSYDSMFEGLMTDQHYYIALQGACIDLINRKDLNIYPEDLAEQPTPEVVADAVNRLCTAMASLYGMPGEQITPETGPYPVGMRVNYNDGRYWQAEVCIVKDFGVVRDATSDPEGAIWTHGMPVGQLAYLLVGLINPEPFWCNEHDVLPEGT